ncbi:hypothetical protein EXM90_19015 [Clostridium botulinum]|uniref:hypothetical protein n=1 Tax=Clostridium botulinum TaxID=1491 RepID=UPI00077473C4|nr:hypothetical protein [Clostridium botulinum]MBN3367044.1 hypothetical protein [Clostridium botulinum]MBN3371680.1 hypothetical protein [Clostridium botulinum]MBN3375514.1 hypothetical protein [Clostridium botulinum]MBN3384171.1 hypothetical protein [Clostridium botulinum]MBN3402864.1 hypothetical protein [Clostridium botulinum]
MANLNQVKENFVLIGEAMINKDMDRYVKTEPLGKNGWMKKRLNLGVKVSDLNKIYVELEAGFWSDETIEKTKNETGLDKKGKPNKKQNWVYNGEMQEDKWVEDNIPFEKRFEQEMIDKVPYYNRIRVSLEPETIGVDDGNGNIVSQPKTDEDGKIIYKNKEFIFAGDAIDYVKKHLKNGQKIYIYGHTEINQYISQHDNQLKTRFNRIIDQIRVAKDDEENTAEGTTNFYFEKDGFDKSDFKKSKKYYIQGHRTYKNNDKVITPVPVNYILDFSSPNVDWENEDIKARVEYLVDVFESAKKEKVYLTQWRYLIFEGNEEAELTEKDLSKDLQKRVKLGFITLEQAIKQMRGSSVGDKIKELKLVMPLGEENKTLMEDLTVEDLIPPTIENKINEVKEEIKEEQEKKEEKLKSDVTKSFDAMFK